MFKNLVAWNHVRRTTRTEQQAIRTHMERVRATGAREFKTSRTQALKVLSSCHDYYSYDEHGLRIYYLISINLEHIFE